MKIIPLTLAQANELVAAWHRHSKPVTGHRFSIGCVLTVSVIVGAAIVGRPIARKTEQYLVAEVTRLVTTGEKNACSFLYSACARIAREMGFEKIQTFIREDEPGTSLTAAGWTFDGFTDSAVDRVKWSSRNGRDENEKQRGRKQRWSKVL